MWEFPVKSRQYYDYFSILASVCLLVRADAFKIISGLVSERMNSLPTRALFFHAIGFLLYLEIFAPVVFLLSGLIFS